ncbi:amidohydrolase family protein [Pelomonas sp. SE-A7]|uniref:amidohydrolase family protein n=1 Tax=Pelomonas sp. SE-A7 TaxID=3054953 RepID=UPI00259CF546|nr:amidohydrolase family protein [Pelomonas sp. SE-A7]MDM4768382.1 amidohydrolase family protein [Pelomonas sp. SE-A7]
MHQANRRHLLCCGAAAAAGLFTALGSTPARSMRLMINDCAGALPPQLKDHPLLQRCWQDLDPAQLWDVHAHLLGTGDSGSGCRISAQMTQWWHPVESIRRKVILAGACVPADAPSIDRAYVERLLALTADFPAGARWMLYAFDVAMDKQGRPRPEWTTFHVPDGYASRTSQQHPQRFAWVASIHPYREDALTRLDAAIRGGAVALKWLPSSMNIDLREPRLRPFYERLAAARLPLIVHCGEEKAVPGAGREELGNPLHARVPLSMGVRVIMAHCASLGTALDLDQKRPRPAQAFDLFARLMDEPAWQGLLLGDVSALFQSNRRPEAWQTVLARQDWHERLLHGSDYPLPGVGPLYRLGGLVRAGLLVEADVKPLEQIRSHNPLLFDLALKRVVRHRGQALLPTVFATRRHFVIAQAQA